ncbi:MAG: hypothetical protein IPK16_19540 [Anaerolineales bacterium]|nr:hypothetical protein [Anaerolineales bacterium]
MQRVWPWLVQLGQGRSGFYSYYWLENQFAAEMVNADEILPQFQDTAPGTKIPLMKNGPVVHTVSLIEAPHYLMLDDGWFMLLEPIDGHTARLVVRYALTLAPVYWNGTTIMRSLNRRTL